MKKAIATLLPIFITACSGEIDLVQNGIMNINRTLTVGEAFNSWSECEKSDWNKLESDNGVNLVEFKCTVKSVPQMMDYTRVAYGEQPCLNLVGIEKQFQWSINKDGSFQLNDVKDIYEYEDGVVKTTRLGYFDQEIRRVYQDKVTVDLTALEAASPSKLKSLTWDMKLESCEVYLHAK
jgi:hypothetical protein